MYPGFKFAPLDPHTGIWQGCLPVDLCTAGVFDSLWALHPDDFPSIFLHGRKVALPRWQQAYGQDYLFSGQASKALAVPAELMPFLEWARQAIDPRFNGALLNWYDGALGHYIGAHRDSTIGLADDSVIVMISLGEARVTRLRPAGGKGFTDFDSANGSVIVLPLTTNRRFKHEVPRFKRHTCRRISITLRSFETAACSQY